MKRCLIGTAAVGWIIYSGLTSIAHERDRQNACIAYEMMHDITPATGCRWVHPLIGSAYIQPDRPYVYNTCSGNDCHYYGGY